MHRLLCEVAKLHSLLGNLQSNIPWHIRLTILFYLLNFISKKFIWTQLGVTHFYLIYISIYDFASAAANSKNMHYVYPVRVCFQSTTTTTTTCSVIQQLFTPQIFTTYIFNVSLWTFNRTTLIGNTFRKLYECIMRPQGIC